MLKRIVRFDADVLVGHNQGAAPLTPRRPRIDCILRLATVDSRWSCAGSCCLGARSMASKVLSSKGDMDTVALLLGHTNIGVCPRYIDVRETR